jgi:hypothetical protein
MKGNTPPKSALYLTLFSRPSPHTYTYTHTHTQTYTHCYLLYYDIPELQGSDLMDTPLNSIHPPDCSTVIRLGDRLCSACLFDSFIFLLL